MKYFKTWGMKYGMQWEGDTSKMKYKLHQEENIDAQTSRIRVPGGWLYRWVSTKHMVTGGDYEIAQTVVPDPDEDS